MREDAISEVIRTTREDLDISLNELAAMTGMTPVMLSKLERNCGSVPIRVLSVVLDALELEMEFRKPLDPEDVDVVARLNVREYTTIDDYTSAQEWAQNAYRMAIANAAMVADLREAY